jgi:hypothetical protein
MNRLLYHSSAGLSLLLLTAALFLWPYSHFYEDCLAWRWNRRYCSVTSHDGCLQLTWQTGPRMMPFPPPAPTVCRWGSFAVWTDTHVLWWPSYHHSAKFGYEFIGHSTLGTVLQVPDWSLALLLSVFPALWFFRWCCRCRRTGGAFPVTPGNGDSRIRNTSKNDYRAL